MSISFPVTTLISLRREGDAEALYFTGSTVGLINLLDAPWLVQPEHRTHPNPIDTVDLCFELV